MTGLAGGLDAHAAGPFPAVFELSGLHPALGGDGSAGFILNGIDVADYSAVRVSDAGDVNGDGIADVLIGARNAYRDAGEGYVVFGRTSGFAAMFLLSDLLPENGGDGGEGFILRGIDGFDFAGHSVSGSGDVNGDGIGDLLIALRAPIHAARTEPARPTSYSGARQAFRRGSSCAACSPHKAAMAARA